MMRQGGQQQQHYRHPGAARQDCHVEDDSGARPDEFTTLKNSGPV
jgi:hypothetical protein